MEKNLIPSAAFNTPLEAGIRAISILLPAFPAAYDIQKLVAFDHLIVHTGDVGGPESLRPNLPLRSTEILVRRGLVERGLLLMISRGLAERTLDAHGIYYQAREMTEPFLSNFAAPYLKALRERGIWVVKTFGDFSDDLLRETMARYFAQWLQEFQASQHLLETQV